MVVGVWTIGRQNRFATQTAAIPIGTINKLGATTAQTEKNTTIHLLI